MFRKMRRFKQQLSDAECVKILTEEPRGVLAVHGDDGYPYAVPLNFFYDGGKLYFHGAGEGHKLDAIRRDEKVSFCVTDKGEKPDDDWAMYVKSVIVFGRIRIMRDTEKKLEICRRLGQKYYPDAAEVEEEIRKDGGRVTMLELDIEHMTGKRVHEK